jgi:renalase
MRIAIIGAGIGGLALAHGLKTKPDYNITIFEKSRGFGGRMSTRYIPPYTFDHGAQYFTARSEKFKEFLSPYLADGTVKEWQGTIVTLSHHQEMYKRPWFEPHYVACPTMSSLAKKIAQSMDVRRETEIVPLTERANEGWHLYDKNNQDMGVFDWCISNAPVVQTIRLLPHLVQNRPELQNVQMKGNFTLMLGLQQKPDFSWAAARVINSPIGWISSNHTKPDRDPNFTSLVIQSTAEWAEEHMNDDQAKIRAILLAQAQSLCPFQMSDKDAVSPHSWRYASVTAALHEPYVVDAAKQLGAVGDWCLDGRVEDAWSSGMQLAEYILGLV